jgi:hypothetical protein
VREHDRPPWRRSRGSVFCEKATKILTKGLGTPSALRWFGLFRSQKQSLPGQACERDNDSSEIVLWMRPREEGRVSKATLALRSFALSALVLATATASATAASWSMHATPTPLQDVSCVSLSACFAVGATEDGSAVAQEWNGGEWTTQALPSTNTLWSYLNAVSCSSATACTAVGNKGYPYAPLAERWNGTEWSLQTIPDPNTHTVPDPTEEETNLDAISCPSVSACMAVGEANDKQFSEQWNGAQWTIAPMPSPGAGEAYAFGVSCTAADECTAVGMHFEDEPGKCRSEESCWKMFAERWNGTAWSLQTIPTPSGAGQTRLYGVSCSSSTACTAVGTYSNGTLYSGIAERWNGTTWSQQTLPAPPPGQEYDLDAVSCASVTECTAVGITVGDAVGTVHEGYGSLAEHWNGTAWSVEAVPDPSGVEQNPLAAVSCVTAVECMAVGRSGNAGLVEIDPPEEVAQKIREAEAASQKRSEEREANSRKVREEEEAATRAKHEEEVAALKTSQEKEAAEKRFREEETATKEAEAAGTKIREAEAAAARKSNEERGTAIGPATLTATTSSVVPFTRPAQSAYVLPAKAKPLTEAQKLKACKRLSKHRRMACEARVKNSYSTKHGKYVKS